MLKTREIPPASAKFDIVCTLVFFIFLAVVVLYPLEVGALVTAGSPSHQAAQQIVKDEPNVQQRALELRLELLYGK